MGGGGGSSFTKIGTVAQERRTWTLQKYANKIRQNRKNFKAHLTRPSVTTEDVLHMMMVNTQHPLCARPGPKYLKYINTFIEKKQPAILATIGFLNKRPERYTKGQKDIIDKSFFLRNKNSYSILLLTWINWLILS